MSIDEIVKRLDVWQKRHAALCQQTQALAKLTGAMPDCELMLPVLDVWNAYTSALSELIGDDDGWLEWYQFEGDMGRKPMGVSLGGKTINVRTLRHLARVIAY